MKQSKKTVQQQLAELETIAQWFERENIDIEEGIKKFEAGLAIASEVKQKLATLQNKIIDVKNEYRDSCG